MKKNITIIILILTNLFTIVFGMVKVTQNQVIIEKNKILLMNALNQAELNAVRANANADSARVAAERAVLEKKRSELITEQLAKANEELKKCK